MTILRRPTRVILLLAAFLLAPATLRAQGDAAFALTAESLRNGQPVALDRLGWRYRAGDDAAWAAPQFDDSSWEVLDGTALTPDRLPQTGWHGIGWFRLRLSVAPELADTPLTVRVQHYGASEIYVDGKLVERFGTVGANAEAEQSSNPRDVPLSIVFAGGGEHLIAVRHSCMALRDMTSGRGKWLAEHSTASFTGGESWIYGAGFTLRAYESNRLGSATEKLRTSSTSRVFLTGVFAAIGLLHLLLFWFYPRQRANLFFSIYALSVTLRNILGFLTSTTDYEIETWVAMHFATWFTIPLLSLGYLAFLYAAFHLRVPKYFWLLLAAFYQVILYTLIFGHSSWQIWLLVAVQLIIGIEVIRITVQALMKRLDGAWIVGIATLLFALNPFITAVRIAGIEPPAALVFIYTRLAAFGIIIAISVYLARNFARTNFNLEAQLANVKDLSTRQLEHERTEAELRLQHEKERAENERRAKELEEARQLQLSMLPKKVPQLPNLEIAAYMKPATEVGGDYYDFHVGDDGTLTVAVGDATGHGLKAGTMVTATKSLFNNLAHEADITSIFKQTSRSLKKMNLRGLYMAMSMVKVKDRRMTIGMAGMPSVLVHRAATKQVEEVAIKAMPLGSVANFPYQQQEMELQLGDTVMLMSDGFPEMFNEAREILDYGKARTILEEVAHKSPQEIINHFARIGEEWAGSRPPDDDVTFVVLKVKNGNSAAQS